MSRSIFWALHAFLLLLGLIVLIFTVDIVISSGENFDVKCRLSNGYEGKCVSRSACSLWAESSLLCGKENVCCANSQGVRSQNISSVRTFNGKNPSNPFLLVERVDTAKIGRKVFVNYKRCGNALSDRVFGGTKASPGDFPYFAALKYKTDNASDRGFVIGCGGSLISGD